MTENTIREQLTEQPTVLKTNSTHYPIKGVANLLPLDTFSSTHVQKNEGQLGASCSLLSTTTQEPTGLPLQPSCLLLL